MKPVFLFCLILLLAACLRFFYLQSAPPGFYSDEASYAYNAYSILQTGKDEYGVSWPIGLQSFGDYKAPLYAYLLVPVIAVFGMGESVIRSVSATLGVVSVILLYYLVCELRWRKRVALLSAYILAILPFALQFQRMAHENTLVLVLFLSGTLSFLYARKQPWWYLLSAIFFGLSIYAYHDARVITPVFVFFLVVHHWRFLKREKMIAIASGILLIVLSLPLVSFLRSDLFWSRPSRTIFLADPGTILAVNQDVGEDRLTGYWLPRLFHNKVTAFGTAYLQHYTAHFSPQFLLWEGDPVPVYQTPNTGLLLFVMAPFLLLGCYVLFRQKQEHRWLVAVWFLLSPIPAALTRFVPSASRMLTWAPVLSLLIALGLSASVSKWKNQSVRMIIALIIAGAFVFNSAQYLHEYYLHLLVKYAKEWHYGMKEVMDQVRQRQGTYQTIWFSKKAWGYIYPLYYLPYPPQQYQPQARLSALNEYGFGWVSGFDKYLFADVPSDWQMHGSTLYIGTPEEFSSGVVPVFIVRYPDGLPAFYGVEAPGGEQQ